MAKINVLKSEIYNKIAAGEVVERPASVVKELIENSIDAGACNIKIEILDGGTKLIKITDDGIGIERDYVKTAFLPHATSKIEMAQDLENIETLGFRGEALSSIASVSIITLKTKTQDSQTGTLLELKGGKVENLSECAMQNGSVFCVENLFFNTPARLKFLKSKKTEEAEITNIVARFILANPKLNFKYLADNKTIYDYTGKDLLEALYTIYGENVYNNVLKIDYEKNGFKLQGYIGKPDFSKPNRTYQTLIINDRFITNSLISTAVYNAYGGFLMTRKYPFFVLNFSMPCDMLDVNVHPSKSDVRFFDNNAVYGIFYNCVFNTLTKNTTFDSIADEKTDNLNPALNDENLNQNLTFAYKQEKPVSFEKPKISFNENNRQENFQYSFDNNSFAEFKVADSGEVGTNEEQKPAVKEQITMHMEALSYKIIGTAFDTYIILETNGSVLFIDQHAAMERLLYDKLKNDINSKNIAVQPLLIPYVLNVNSAESHIILENADIFKAMGFSIEEFGNNCFKVSEVPLIFNGLDFDKFFGLFFNEETNLKTLKQSDLIKEKLAQIACKASVKAGDVLKNEEIENLILKIQNGAVLLCPHGRPIVIKHSKTDIEKWFKRIV